MRQLFLAGRGRGEGGPGGGGGSGRGTKVFPLFHGAFLEEERKPIDLIDSN